MARIPASVERKTLPRVRVSGFGSFESDTIFIAAMLPWLRIHHSVRLWGLCLINPCDKYPSVRYTETFCNIYFYTLYPWLHHHNSKQVDRAMALLCRFLYEVRCFGISKGKHLWLSDQASGLDAEGPRQCFTSRDYFVGIFGWVWIMRSIMS